MPFRCGYCPALSVRDGPCHSRSCPRYKPPAPRKQYHSIRRWTDEEISKKVITLKDGKKVAPVGVWSCRKCGFEWYDCSKPRPNAQPDCATTTVSKVMES